MKAMRLPEGFQRFLAIAPGLMQDDVSFVGRTERTGMWVWSKLNKQGTAGFSAWFHLAGFHFGYLFLTQAMWVKIGVPQNGFPFCLPLKPPKRPPSRRTHPKWHWATLTDQGKESVTKEAAREERTE